MMSEENTIWKRRTNLDTHERELRKGWMYQYHNTPEYKQYQQDMKSLQEECGKLGHVRGKFWDNGLGTTWYYCAHCGATFDIEKYDLGLSDAEEDE
jgi:hypothetical protein